METKPNMKVMICLILDRSGSMGGREKDVVGGVNAFIAEQQKLPSPATMAMVRFDSKGIERFRPMIDLSICKPMEAHEFQPRGGTPLLDAIGQTITGLDEDWKREQPERCIVIVITDGEENESKSYTKAQIKQMIQAREDSKRWSFIYLGAGVDAFAEASAMGYSYLNTAGYQNTARGTHAMYASASESVNYMRSTGATFAANLGGNIGEDGIVTKTVATAPTVTTVAGGAAITGTWSPPPGVTVTWVPPDVVHSTVTAWAPPG